MNAAHARLLVVLGIALGVLAIDAAALARPGGGNTFGGSSRSSGGSGFSGGGSSFSGGSGSDRSSGGSGFSGGSSFSGGSGSNRSSGGSSFSGGSTFSGGSERSTPRYEPPPETKFVHLRTAALDRPATDRKKRVDGASVWGPTKPVSEWKGVMPKPSFFDDTRRMTIAFSVVAGVLVLVGVTTSTVRWLQQRRLMDEWSTAPPVRTELEREFARKHLERGRAAITSADPDFSLILFEDFLYALFSETRVAAGEGRLDRFAPYLRSDARRVLMQLVDGPATTIVIGSMRFLDFGGTDPEWHRIRVEFESNYETPSGAWAVLERWTLLRKKTARSRPPARARVFDCPGCGASLDLVISGTCKHCNQVVTNGDFDWVVDAVHVEGTERRGPMLTSNMEEVGTDLPTVVDADVKARFGALATRDAAFDFVAFQRRVELVHREMGGAWATLTWERARPFLTDHLFATQGRWIDAYKKQSLRNCLERSRVLRFELARVAQDRWFDQIVLRVFATGLDYTVRVPGGEVVSGSRTKERRYSEYWTLIRSRTATGAAHTAPECPKCGAALAISMAGTCNYCQAKVNSGEFDWVLARIEQDEVYG